ncbi:MAG: homoserine O-succinyltransferase [Rhizobiales bacterium]|nr:homoserine O-succinyltransferase [Hyphomicrobiales bacterium]
MTLALPTGLPAIDKLRREGLPVTSGPLFATAARPVLRVGLVNLMPDKITTETQIARQLAGCSLPIDLTFLCPASRVSRNTCARHLARFYKDLGAARHLQFDGVIVTGAPVEMMAFEEVDYWHELTALFDVIKQTGTPGLFICWAAQAALHHYHGVPKHVLKAKASGVYPQQVFRYGSPCVAGMGAQFATPVSRHTEVRWDDLLNVPDLYVAAASRETGVGLVEDEASSALYMFNHLEYDADTLAREYERDQQCDQAAPIPKNYFPDDNPWQAPHASWARSARRFFANWTHIAEQRRSAKALRPAARSLDTAA